MFQCRSQKEVSFLIRERDQGVEACDRCCKLSFTFHASHLIRVTPSRAVTSLL